MTTNPQGEEKHLVWKNEHSELIDQIYTENEYAILEYPPNLFWLADPSTPVKLIFGTSENGIRRMVGKPSNPNPPTIWLSTIIDKAADVSNHHKEASKNESELVKKNLPQTKYYDYLLLYLYNIFHNNCTSRDRRGQLMENIKYFEYQVGARKTLPGSSGGDMGNGGGFLSSIMNALGPALKGITPNDGQSLDGSNIMDGINRVVENPETQQMLSGITAGLSEAMNDPQGLNPEKMFSAVTGVLNQDSMERISKIAEQVGSPIGQKSNSNSNNLLNESRNIPE